MSSSCYWWGAKFSVSFSHLDDTLNTHIKFDNNRSSSFRNYLLDTQNNRQTDGNGRHIFSQSRGHETLKKNESIQSPDYNTSLAYSQKVKNTFFQYPLRFLPIPSNSFLFFPNHCYIFPQIFSVSLRFFQILLDSSRLPKIIPIPIDPS